MGRFPHSIVQAAAPAAVVALLATACGGGGGEEEEFIPFNQPATLSTDTAPAAAGLMVDAALAGITAASVGGVIIASEDSATGGSPPGLLAVTRTVLDTVAEMSLTGALTGVQISVEPPASRLCTGGGQVVAVWTDRAPEGELSAGDFGRIGFQACQERGFTLGGGVGLTITAFDELTGFAAYALIFEELTASAAGGSVLAIGNLNVEVTTGASAVGTRLSTPFQGLLSFEEPDRSVTELTDYEMFFAEASNGDFEISAGGSGTVGFSGLGQASFEITEPFSGNGFDTSFPSAGQMLISGAGGTAIRLTVVDSTQVQLEVDEGTGSFGPPFNRTWEQILAAAAAVD